MDFFSFFDKLHDICYNYKVNEDDKMKKYKPKKWFTYTRLTLTFMIIFLLGRTTNVVYSVVTSTDENKDKALDHKVIAENKEEIYYEENPVLNKYLSIPEKGFVVTNTNQTYSLSTTDFNLLVAVVSSESNKKKDDILAVTSVILNRCDRSGKTPIEVITAPGQFSGYLQGYYMNYLNNDNTLKSNTTLVQEVVTDALNGVRNNTYYSFRSWNSYYYGENYIVEYGNRFN